MNFLSVFTILIPAIPLIIGCGEKNITKSEYERTLDNMTYAEVVKNYRFRGRGNVKYRYSR